MSGLPESGGWPIYEYATVGEILRMAGGERRWVQLYGRTAPTEINLCSCRGQPYGYPAEPSWQIQPPTPFVQILGNDSELEPWRLIGTRRETVSLIGSDKVEGTAVYGADNRKIGTVQRVMIDKISGKD
jgi:hypothetical protein